MSQIGHTAAVLPEVRDFLLGEEESPFLRLEFDSSERRKKNLCASSFFPKPPLARRGRSRPRRIFAKSICRVWNYWYSTPAWIFGHSIVLKFNSSSKSRLTREKGFQSRKRFRWLEIIATGGIGFFFVLRYRNWNRLVTVIFRWVSQFYTKKSAIATGDGSCLFFSRSPSFLSLKVSSCCCYSCYFSIDELTLCALLFLLLLLLLLVWWCVSADVFIPLLQKPPRHSAHHYQQQPWAIGGRLIVTSAHGPNVEQEQRKRDDKLVWFCLAQCYGRGLHTYGSCERWLCWYIGWEVMPAVMSDFW